jgi:hypothetical protein
MRAVNDESLGYPTSASAANVRSTPDTGGYYDYSHATLAKLLRRAPTSEILP